MTKNCYLLMKCPLPKYSFDINLNTHLDIIMNGNMNTHLDIIMNRNMNINLDIIMH